jgi:hypothetical protein
MRRAHNPVTFSFRIRFCKKLLQTFLSKIHKGVRRCGRYFTRGRRRKNFYRSSSVHGGAREETLSQERRTFRSQRWLGESLSCSRDPFFSYNAKRFLKTLLLFLLLWFTPFTSRGPTTGAADTVAGTAAVPVQRTVVARVRDGRKRIETAFFEETRFKGLEPIDRQRSRGVGRVGRRFFRGKRRFFSKKNDVFFCKIYIVYFF